MKILNRMPVPDIDSKVLGPDGRPLVKRYQITVWVSLSAKGDVEWDPARHQFRAVLDTELNHNFARVIGIIPIQSFSPQGTRPGSGACIGCKDGSRVPSKWSEPRRKREAAGVPQNPAFG
jgi:hypothetical protein